MVKPDGIHNPFMPLPARSTEIHPREEEDDSPKKPKEIILDGDSYWLIFEETEEPLKSRLFKLFYEVNNKHPNQLSGLGVYVYDKLPDRLPPHEKALTTDSGSLAVYVEKLDTDEVSIYRRLAYALYTLADHKLYKKHGVSVRKVH